jgi:putative pyruvate formate lyase activating enzyme
MQQRHSDSTKLPSGDQATLLELKIEIAWRLLTNCTLCAHRCGVDRTAGKIGVCRLGVEGTVAEHFVHIGEEAPINPSLVLNLAGCGLRCRYCQQGAILDPARVNGARLDEFLWASLDTEGARSLSFVGGNPDESLYAILRFLASAPQDWALPVIWNSHAYATMETLTLLHGLVDAYVPDYKYGNNTCGLRLSSARDYSIVAVATIGAMLAQEVPVIVRILVLPGHLECCHVPTLEALAGLRDNGTLLISVRGQYCPDWRIGPRDGVLARRAMPGETETVRAKADTLGLVLVD